MSSEEASPTTSPSVDSHIVIAAVSPPASTDQPTASSDGITNIILPRYIYIKGVKSNGYLSSRDGKGVMFYKPAADESCIFEVVSYQSEIHSLFLKNSGWYLGRVDSPPFPPYIRLLDNAVSAQLDDASKAATASGAAYADPRTFGLMQLAVGPKGEQNFYITIGRPDAPSFATSPSYMSEDTYEIVDVIHVFENMTVTIYPQPSPVTLIIEPAITNQVITDVKYDIAPGQASIDPLPPYIQSNVLTNNATSGDAASSGATMTETFAFEVSTVGTWSNSLGYEIAASISFKAGVPGIAEVQTSVTVKQSGEWTWGGEKGTTTTMEKSVTANVPPGSRRKVTLTVSKANLTVNFTYKETVTYSNGIVETKAGNGVYNNVESWSAVTTIEDV